MLKSNVELMASYNQWMNEKMYQAASQLSAGQLAEDRGAFFSSIIGTLNHILVGDTLWLQRFAEHSVKFVSLDSVRQLEAPRSLDAMLYQDFDGLWKARIAMDAVIVAFAKELTEEVLADSLTYCDTKGNPYTKRLAYLVQHLFNHQTHHRGQVSTMLSQAGADVGVTDLLFQVPEG